MQNDIRPLDAHEDIWMLLPEDGDGMIWAGGGMFYFMIDFENTRSKGLHGAEYLLPDDNVTIFYSQSSLKVEKGLLQQVVDAGSVLNICRLQKTGKNALDYYIASRIGELFGGGYQGRIAIVSGDKGYSAVQDYWAYCAEPARKIVVGPNIEQCIGRSNENSERKRTIQGKLQEVNLETQYGLYEEHLRIRQDLEDRFADAEYRELLGQIVNIAESKKGRRSLYLDSVKQFGRKRGLEIYTRIRQRDRQTQEIGSS